MPPRNHKDWIKTPKVEYINSLIYSDQSLYEQEVETIFSKVWVPCFHKSELPNAGNFRTGQIAGQRRNLAQALRNRGASIPQSIRNRFNQDNLIGALQGSRFYGQTLE